MTTTSQLNNNGTRHISTEKFGRVEIRTGEPVPSKQVLNRRTRTGKYGDLSSILDSLKIGESFTITALSKKEYIAMIAHLSAYGRKVRRTFTQRRASTDKGCLKFSIWRMRYAEPEKRRPKGAGAPSRSLITSIRRSTSSTGAPLLLVNEETE